MTEQTIFERLETAKTAEEFDAKAAEIEAEAIAKAEASADTRPNLRGRLNSAVKAKLRLLVIERLSYVVYEKRVRMGFTPILTDPEAIRERDEGNEKKILEAIMQVDAALPIGTPDRMRMKARDSLERKLRQGIAKKRAIDRKILKEREKEAQKLISDEAGHAY